MGQVTGCGAASANAGSACGVGFVTAGAQAASTAAAASAKAVCQGVRRARVQGCVAVGSLAAGLALRRDRIRLASQCFLVSLWVGVLLQALVFGGLDNAGLFALPVLLLATGWLLGLRAARWLTLVSVLALMAIGAATRSTFRR